MTVFSVTHLDVRNIFLRNLPEEISGYCSLIDVVTECSRGESETLALLRCSGGENMLLFKPKTKEVEIHIKREGVPQALNSPSSGLRVWMEAEGVCEVCVRVGMAWKNCCGIYPHRETSLWREALGPGTTAVPILLPGISCQGSADGAATERRVSEGRAAVFLLPPANLPNGVRQKTRWSRCVLTDLPPFCRKYSGADRIQKESKPLSSCFPWLRTLCSLTTRVST